MARRPLEEMTQRMGAEVQLSRASHKACQQVLKTSHGGAARSLRCLRSLSPTGLRSGVCTGRKMKGRR